jgi:hypothetical protein
MPTAHQGKVLPARKKSRLDLIPRLSHNPNAVTPNKYATTNAKSNGSSAI